MDEKKRGEHSDLPVSLSTPSSVKIGVLIIRPVLGLSTGLSLKIEITQANT
jgi:hypothetical protein